MLNNHSDFLNFSWTKWTITLLRQNAQSPDPFLWFNHSQSISLKYRLAENPSQASSKTKSITSFEPVDTEWKFKGSNWPESNFPLNCAFLICKNLLFAPNHPHHTKSQPSLTKPQPNQTQLGLVQLSLACLSPTVVLQPPNLTQDMMLFSYDVKAFDFWLILCYNHPCDKQTNFQDCFQDWFQEANTRLVACRGLEEHENQYDKTDLKENRDVKL